MLAKWFVAGLLLISGAGSAAAACVEDFRPVTLGDQAGSAKAYICRSPGVHIRVEFHRLTTAATSALLSQTHSGALRSMLGTPQVIRNDVSEVVEDILTRFASTYESQWATPLLGFAGPQGGYVQDYEEGSAPDIVVLETDWLDTDGFYYPAINEIRKLREGRLPGALHQIGSDRVWRFLRQKDLSDYQANLARFNEYFAGRPGPYGMSAGRDDPTIELMSYLSQGSLPPDFAALVGWFSEGGCATGEGWVFEYFPRIPIVDAITIENLSSSAANIGGWTGTYSTGGLRPPTGSGLGAQIFDVSLNLGPGQSVLVPTGLVFAPSDELREFTTSIYAFGPAYDITGLIVDGSEILFEERSANFTQLSLLAESGSCPFLLSRRDDGKWIDRGKILHRARGLDNEYREEIAFDGLRTEYRLEEREPEAAYIDEAILRVFLDDGAELALRPDREDLANGDGNRSALLWGETMDFSFALPDDIDPDSVVRSELAVTGHYIRYSSLRPVSASAGRHVSWPDDLGVARFRPQACPLVGSQRPSASSLSSRLSRVAEAQSWIAFD
ncbi:MAG: lamin tail domain-containing protein [Hyphomicrobiales bacterium]|nr:lamin tail domain-containing protein [Hyphomicrobiales bacterium]